MKQFIRKMAEKFSNFKFLARIMICVSAVVAVITVLGFVAFEFSRGINPETNSRVCAFGALKEGRQIIGMIFFFVLTVSLVLAIVVAYQSKTYAFPKTKMAPNKSLPVLCVVNGGFGIVAGIFSILAVVVDVPVGESEIPATQIGWAWYILAVLFIIAGLVQLCFLLPVLKSHYYMPKFGEEEK